jgi:RimK family alpha-L-glutamate ligase
LCATLGLVITALIGSPTRTTLLLADAWRAQGVDARVMWPQEANALLEPGDVALVRLDVLPTLDGVEPGLEHISRLQHGGVRVLNRPEPLLATHDKLVTARRLAAAGLPTPWTTLCRPGGRPPLVPYPCVVKPRFGSWGQDIYRCANEEELTETLLEVGERPWSRRHGALVQALIGTSRTDIRVVVAGDRVVAAATRAAAEGEWRTNISLGGRIVKAELPAGTERLALRAAAAIGIDLASVDMLPGNEGWVVIELNGAVDFDDRYALPGIDPYLATLDGLGIPRPTGGDTLEPEERKEKAMAKTVLGKPVRPGDEIAITGHSVGDAPRTAVILGVLGEPGRERFHVRWEDDHESIFFPGEDAVVHRPIARRVRRATKT